MHTYRSNSFQEGGGLAPEFDRPLRSARVIHTQPLRSPLVKPPDKNLRSSFPRRGHGHESAPQDPQPRLPVSSEVSLALQKLGVTPDELIAVRPTSIPAQLDSGLPLLIPGLPQNFSAELQDLPAAEDGRPRLPKL